MRRRQQGAENIVLEKTEEKIIISPRGRKGGFFLPSLQFFGLMVRVRPQTCKRAEKTRLYIARVANTIFPTCGMKRGGELLSLFIVGVE